MAELYFLSDEAFEYLLNQAVTNKFVRSDSLHKVGISRFLNRLANRLFLDNRPAEIKDNDNDNLVHWRTPVWTYDYKRSRRKLDLDDDAVQLYIQKAIDFKIVMPRPFIGGPSMHSLNAIVSATIEAIGICWLTPTNNNWPLYGGERT